MKARTLVPALALAAALLAPPLADARDRHGPRGRRPPAHGYYGHRPGHGSYGYRPVRPRPHHRGYGRYRPAPYYGYYPPAYYGYGFGYGYYPPPPPPPRYCPPRPRVGVWFGF